MMEYLPYELLGQISSHLERPFAPYAVISRRWQHLIEARTFSSIRLSTSDETELPQFSAVFLEPRRRAILTKLRFIVRLPPPSKKRNEKFRGRREAAADSARYTQAVYDLFSRLQSWETDASGRVPSMLDLHVCTQCLGRYRMLKPESPYESFADFNIDPRRVPASYERDAYSHLITYDDKAVQSQAFPCVSFVTSLVTEAGIHPSLVARFANALPGVQGMSLYFEPPGRRLPARRQELRSSLGRVLLQGSFHSLTHLSIRWDDRNPQNEALDPGDLCDPESNRDLLSLGVRRISQLPRLKELHLRGCHVLCHDVFSLESPPDGSRSDPPWPYLTTMTMELSLTTPDGGWFFTGDPPSSGHVSRGNDDTDEWACDPDSSDSDKPDFYSEPVAERLDGEKPICIFRFGMDPAVFGPFISAAARAVRESMPSLRHLECRWGGLHGVTLRYSAPGVQNPNKGWLDNDRAFDDAHLAYGRWVFEPWSYDIHSPQCAYEIPSELQQALRDITNGEDCILVIRRTKYLRSGENCPPNSVERPSNGKR